MIKNETKINQKEKNHLLNSISDKENKNEENIKDIKSNNFDNIYNKIDDRKYFLINNNTIPENTLENQTTANKKSSKKNIINKSLVNNNLIPLSSSTNFTSKRKSIELNTEKQINMKPFYTAFSAKNMFSTNTEVSSFSLLNRSNTPTNHNFILNKLNKENIQNFISTTKNKAYFGSLLFKNHSHKNMIKNQMKNEQRNQLKNNKGKNINKILLKYSKEYKNNTNNNEDKLNDILEKIKIKKNEKELNNQSEEKENEINNINNINKTRNKNKIPFNQKIFNKIIEEVKDEKSYIQKVVHRKLMNQREIYRNSLVNNNFKKYDTNTYNKEITTKRIKNPFNTSLNKDLNENILNRNYSMKRNLKIKTVSNENNKLNSSCANINNKLNNLNNFNEEISTKKKNSIKIKKIPLNKLKHKIQVNNPVITNYIFTNENNFNQYNNNNYYNDMNCNTHRIVLSKNNNIRFSDNFINNGNNNNYSFSNNYQRATEIPKSNNSLFYNINYENTTDRESKQNILYNKVNLRKRASKKIKINLNSNINPINQYMTQEKTDRTNISSCYYDNKLSQEKKLGLFKKKLAGLSSEKQNNLNTSYNYLSLSNINNNKKSNIYSKKLNNTIFKAYISNQTNQNKYMNNNKNESYSNNYNQHINNKNNNINQTYNINMTNTNKRINTTDSITTYDTKYNNININKIKNINYQNLRNDIFNNEYESMSNIYYNTKEEIKLEQIITLLNFEDLLILEDKLNTILIKLKQDKNTSQEFFDLFNYFFSSSLKPKFEQIYKYLLTETEAIKIFINHSLILIIICYDFSWNKNNNNNIKFSLYESIRLIYINLLMVISPMKNKIKSENKDFYNLRLVEMSGINNIINKNLINFNNSTDNENEDDISFNRELLHNNTNLLIKNISLIIKNYKNNPITEIYYSIQAKTISLDDINNFFRQNILREDFIGCSVLASTFLKEKENFSLSPIPYITKPNSKKYSLVLDLDETLIHFKVNHTHNDEGVLKLRPGINTFLEIIKDYYEIILFTEASEAYTELIMEAFNKNNFFEYKFYRQHTIIIGQDFVKDLQRIGRPLEKIIIIDNIAQNFRMQKNNGILIKPFYGEDQNDQALIDLIPILINIAKDNIDTRNGLVKYRDEIMTKITSNLFRRNNDKV